MKLQSAVQKEISKSFDNAVRGLSAIQNLLRRTAEPRDVEDILNSRNFEVTWSGRLSTAIDDAVWVARGAKGVIFTLEDLSIAQDIFDARDVQDPGTMKVPDLVLFPLMRKRQVTKQERGMWKISQPMFDWAASKARTLRNLAKIEKPIPPRNLLDVFTKDLEWVNDDSGLIARAVEDLRDAKLAPHRSWLLLITSDRKLAQRMADTANTRVFVASMLELQRRVNPVVFEWEQLKSFVKNIRTKLDPISVLVDTGHVESVQALEEIQGNVPKKVTYSRFNRNPLRTFRKETSLVVRRQPVVLNEFRPSVERSQKLTWRSKT
jgi:hypothetical protein